MIKISNLIAAGALCFGSIFNTYAQNETDALRYSQLQFGGSARTQGLAGATTALGADIGSISTNPAGLGLYRRSDFSFTPGLSFGNTSTAYLGNTSLNSKGNFNMANFGVVFTGYKGDDYEGNWKSVSFGISFTRHAHYHNRFNYTGVNNDNSITQYFEQLRARNHRDITSLNQEAGPDFNEFTSLEGLAYYTYLINPDTSTGQFYPVVPGGGMRQTETLLSTGSMYQWDFAFGANYRDVLYLGGSVGISNIAYRQQRTYSETNVQADSPLQNLTLSDQFKTTGNGVNLKLGAIFQPINWVRVGASIQTPTFWGLRDTYSTQLSSQFNGNILIPNSNDTVYTQPNYAYQTKPGYYAYNLVTPFRANGGLAFFAGKAGVLSADLEYVNYGTSRLSSLDADNSFSAENTQINQQYQQAVNVRVGAEGRYDIFRVRAGWAHYGDPFANNSGIDRSRMYYTLGGGIKQDNLTFDLAYVYSTYRSLYRPYTLSGSEVPAASTQNQYSNVVATFGVTF